jgi:hypothetical protein
MSMALRSRPLLTTRRARTVSFGLTVGAAAVAAALLSNAAPTGLGTADPVWSALLVGVLAFFGATARRWTWFVPAGVAAFIAGDTLATVLAAAAIAICRSCETPAAGPGARRSSASARSPCCGPSRSGSTA